MPTRIQREQEDRSSDRRAGTFLAISETLGKGAQTESDQQNVEASNLWAFSRPRASAARSSRPRLEWPSSAW